MSITNKNAQTLLRHYESAILHSAADKEEALHNAINAAFPLVSDERKADLCAALIEEWDAWPAGIQRKIFVKNRIERWRINYVFGPEIEAARAKARELPED